jgi:hypothetical protein
MTKQSHTPTPWPDPMPHCPTSIWIGDKKIASLYATIPTMRGNCYVTSEALYHLLGGKDAGWTPQTIRHEGDVHWFLRHTSGIVIDATASQFKSPPDYSAARGRGFLTKQPSKRALLLMQRMVWQE